MRRVFLLTGAIVTLFLASSSEGAFDLGGECEQQGEQSWKLSHNMRAQAARGEWDDAIETGLVYVRDMCQNSYRWAQLVNLFLESPRRAKALDILREMRTRGRDLNVDEIDWNAVEQLEGFDASEIGQLYLHSAREITTLKTDARMRMRHGVLAKTPYWASGVCPGEYCGFGKALLLERSYALLDKPEGGKVGELERCDRVDQLATSYRSPMIPHVVIHDHVDADCHERGEPGSCDSFEKGELLYYVIYSGEGFSRVLHEGKEKIISDARGLLGDCRFPSDRCWVVSLVSTSKDQNVVEEQLWVEVMSSDGTRGWTNEIALYNGYDDVDPDPEQVKRKQALEAECAKNPLN